MQTAQTESSPAKVPNPADDIVLLDAKAVNAEISNGFRRVREHARSTRRPGARQWINVAKDAEYRKKDDILWQFNYCLRTAKLPAGTGIARDVGHGTRTKFGNDCRLVMNQLREENATIRKLSALKVHHLVKLVKRWLQEGRSPSTINGRVTAVRKLTILLGRPGEIPTGAAWKRLLRANDIDPARLERSQIRVIPRSVSSKGLHPRDLIERVKQKCPLQAVWLRLCWVFGMRPKECAELHPMESDKGTSLDLLHGCKADRPRSVSFSNAPERAAEQRSALDEAKRWARKHPQWRLRQPGHSVGQALNRFYYIMRIHGITAEELGVTPYSFRHEFAHEEYKEKSGLDAPVLRKVHASVYEANAEAVASAQRHVVQQMGHSAVHKFNSYGGSVHEEARRLKRQCAVLGIVSGSEQLATAMERASIQEAWLIGKAATGDKLKEGEPILLALRMPTGLSPDAMGALATALQALPRRVDLTWRSDRPDPALEVVFSHQRTAPGAAREGSA